MKIRSPCTMKKVPCYELPILNITAMIAGTAQCG